MESAQSLMHSLTCWKFLNLIMTLWSVWLWSTQLTYTIVLSPTDGITCGTQTSSWFYEKRMDNRTCGSAQYNRLLFPRVRKSFWICQPWSYQNQIQSHTSSCFTSLSSGPPTFNRSTWRRMSFVRFLKSISHPFSDLGLRENDSNGRYH